MVARLCGSSSIGRVPGFHPGCSSSTLDSRSKLFLSSSKAEQTPVKGEVVGSNPALGAKLLLGSSIGRTLEFGSKGWWFDSIPSSHLKFMERWVRG